MFEPGLLIPIFALMIPIVALLRQPISRWIEIKAGHVDAQNIQTAERAAQYGAHIERLERRVRVLERIITERGTDLAAEIERLRDAPLN